MKETRLTRYLLAVGIVLVAATCFSSAACGAPAMRGYSPVALVDARQWMKGREPFRMEFDGATYLFASEAEMQRFRAAPERYTPVFGGDCLVHFAATGQRRRGMLRHGVVHQNRLYFFSSSEARQAFVEAPKQFVNADVALGGNCPVCIVELNQAVPGRAELVAVLGGYRYFFPGAQQREMFLAQPLKYAAAAHAMAGTAESLPGAVWNAGPATQNGSPDRLAFGPDATTDPSQNANAADGGPAADEGGLNVPIALSGYCPVSILDASRWVRGLPDHTVVHDGQRYLFAGEVQKQEFLTNLIKYAPVLGGDCVVSFRDTGGRVPGSVYHAIIHRGRHYLFPSPQQKDIFKSDPDAYEDVDLALNGKCAVCLVDAEEVVDGDPKFTAWHDGLRYQLRGADQLEAFRTDLERYAATELPESETP